MFFILGTGRCGTLSLANTFLEQTSCVCLHQPEPALIEEAPAYRYGDFPAEELVALLRATRSPVLNHKPYGESNQNLSLAIPALEQAFPGAKYVWLLRSGLDVVASLVGRGEYSGGLIGRSYEQCSPVQRRWIDGRIRGDRCGDVSQEQWHGMTAFEKCCWYWSYVNRMIEQDLRDRVGQDRARLVTLEALSDQLDQLVDWLGLKPYSTVEMKRENSAPYALHICDGWSRVEWDAFERWCGPLMDRVYPDWRDIRARHSSTTPVELEPGSESPFRDAVALNAEGERRFQDGDVAAARECFERALGAAPDDPEALSNLGVCLWTEGQVGEALLCFGRGLEISPKDRHLVLNAGQTLTVSGRTDDAKRLYASFLEDFPDDADVRECLAALAPDSACGCAEDTAALETADADSVISEGESRFSDNDFDEAERLFLHGLTLQPDHVDALNNLGVLAWMRSDPGRALDYLRRAMEVKVDHPATLQNLVTVLEGLGHDDVLESVRRALAVAQR